MNCRVAESAEQLKSRCRNEKLSVETREIVSQRFALSIDLNSNCQMRKCPPCKIVRSKWKTNLSKYRKPVICRAVMVAHNGRNYMQLPTAGGFSVEPHRCCCGLHSLLSARKRQLTYSFCYAQNLLCHFIYNSFNFSISFP